MGINNLLEVFNEKYYAHLPCGIDESLMNIFSRDILDSIAKGDPSWETMAPDKTAAFIKAEQLFGYNVDPDRDA
ncbi:MAG: hypothetical protein P8L49_02305 [Opitutaceae bacterium]|nr:hypothetical protein [Opitutaceae bacterium]